MTDNDEPAPTPTPTPAASSAEAKPAAMSTDASGVVRPKTKQASLMNFFKK